MQPFRSHALNKAVARQLITDERVIWSAEKCTATTDAMIIYCLQVLMGVFACLWFYFVLHSSGFTENFQFSPGLLIFLIPLTFTLGFPVFCLLRANRFAYAVTNKRLIILNDFIITIHRTVRPREIEFVTLQQTGDRGTVFLRNMQIFYWSATGLKSTYVLLMPRKIMNAPGAEGAIKPLNALLQIKKDQLAEEAKKPKLNQGLFKPT
ncbi:MAG: hypothetical protein CMK07_12105, partial [Ponticaulis sp.]|nr:hypothetical protein [Ponticaulis sp.]